MKSATRLLAILLVLTLILTGCADTTIDVTLPSPTVEPSKGPPVEIIPAPEGAEVGLVKPHYSFVDSEVAVTLGECGGDTDVLTPTLIRGTYDSLWYHELEFVFDADFPVAFTANHYVDGEIVSDGGIRGADAEGYAERLMENDVWQRISGAKLRSPVPMDLFSSLYESPEPTGPAESDIPTLNEEGAVRVEMPLSEPGTYRYTLYFRESIDHTEDDLTTGETLYTITMLVTIPVSDLPCDLIGFSGEHLIAYDGRLASTMIALVRSNTDEKIYANQSRGKLEIRDGDEWKEVKDGVLTSSQGIWGDDIGGLPRNGLLAEYYVCYQPNNDAEYRITLVFVDEDYKNYEVVLYFSFTE